ncbi:MAG: hypothetical protein ABJA62_03465 [Luteimonas sp.]
MSNVIRFLESLGGNPSLTRLSPAQYAAAVASLNLDDAQQQALLDRDAAALNDLLGGRAKMYCTQYPAREDRPAKRQENEEAPDDGSEDDKGGDVPQDKFNPSKHKN